MVRFSGRDYSKSTGPRGATTGSHGEQYAAKYGFLYGHGQTIGVGRGAKGRFLNTFAAAELNRLMATELQDRVAANIAKSYKRPKVSTGRLIDVTRAPGNRVHGIDYFGVGVAQFLDQSQAKYWRTIEEGSAAVWKHPFVGMPLVGVFGASLTGEYGGRSGSNPYSGPEWTRVGGGTGGKFRPASKAFRDRAIAGGARVPRVHHEIAPMNAYAKAWRQFGAGKRVLDDYLQMLEAASRR